MLYLCSLDLFHIWDVSPTFHFAVSTSCNDLQDTTPGPVGCSVNPTVSHEDLFMVDECLNHFLTHPFHYIVSLFAANSA